MVLAFWTGSSSTTPKSPKISEHGAALVDGKLSSLAFVIESSKEKCKLSAVAIEIFERAVFTEGF